MQCLGKERVVRLAFCKGTGAFRFTAMGGAYRLCTYKKARMSDALRASSPIAAY